MKNLLNQTQFADLHHIKRQRVGQLLQQGELMTEKHGKRIYLVVNKFNENVILEHCGGRGNWNRPRTY